MTDDNNASDHRQDLDTDLPKFSVHVLPTQDAKKHLTKMLVRFRNGELEPLVFGDGNKPEAAVIPFAALVRLMKHDHTAFVVEEDTLQGELSRRVQSSDADRSEGEESGLLIRNDQDLYDWASSLGQVGKEWADEQRGDDRQSHDQE